MPKEQKNKIVQAFERAVDHVVRDFLLAEDGFRNERELHWSLFHYLREQNVVREKYPTQLIRAEFPTEVFADRGARGHYDLVVLAQKPELTEIELAVEVKLWLSQTNEEDAKNLITWDIQKLTDTPGRIRKAYYINFVRLNTEPRETKYHRNLRKWLTEAKGDNQSLKVISIAYHHDANKLHEALAAGYGAAKPSKTRDFTAGLNHAFAKELLWQEYPTDQRGSYFRQFWDPDDNTNNQSTDEGITKKEPLIPPKKKRKHKARFEKNIGGLRCIHTKT